MEYSELRSGLANITKRLHTLGEDPKWTEDKGGVMIKPPSNFITTKQEGTTKSITHFHENERVMVDYNGEYFPAKVQFPLLSSIFIK